MKNSVKRFLRGELIGSKVKVVGSNIDGKILDETKNTFIIKTGKAEEKMVLKNNNIFEFFVGNEKIRVEGKKLCVRHEERTKITKW